MKTEKDTKEILKTMRFSNGFLHLFIALGLLALWVTSLVMIVQHQEDYRWVNIGIPILIAYFILWVFYLCGLALIMPNKSLVLTFFGRYVGTVRQNGFFWFNPFYSGKKISLRARNMNVDPIKVNDKAGNPIYIGMVLVWRIKDTYKACFEIDAEVTTVGQAAQANAGEGGDLKRYDKFVSVQSDSALRKIAGMYAYDHLDQQETEITLRSGGEEIIERLEHELGERLAIAGIEVLEARINYLSYATEIAGVMLRRQQADAIIAAREKIVEGAVSMVDMALKKLSADNIVQLDDEKKASMVSNLLVVLCADEAATPVVNAGTLY